MKQSLLENVNTESSQTTAVVLELLWHEADAEAVAREAEEAALRAKTRVRSPVPTEGQTENVRRVRYAFD